MEQARQRSGWSAKRTLAALGISRRSYYRWLREEAWARALPAEPVKPVSPDQWNTAPEPIDAAVDDIATLVREAIELRRRRQRVGGR